MAYPDTFNRGDGSLGSGWSVITGSVGIVSNMAQASGASRVLAAGQSESGAQDHTVVVPKQSGDFLGQRVVVKSDATALNYYWGSVSSALGTMTISVGWRYNGTDGGISSTTESTPSGDSLSLRVTYADGLTTVYVDGVSKRTLSDASYAAQSGFGFELLVNGAAIDAFDAAGGVSSYLTIAPDQVYVANPANYLSATLHGDTWAGPFPAAGTLSVDHGWLIVQNRDSSTLTTFSYQAFGYIGTVTVTDADTAATGTFSTTSFPVPENGDSAPLTEDGAGILNRTGDSCADPGTILTTCTPIDSEASVNIPKGIDAILEQLGGYYGQVGADIGTDGRPDNVHIPWKKSGLTAWWTIDDVIGLLGGSPTVYSTKDVLDSLTNLANGNLATLRGDESSSLFTVMQQLAYLRTGTEYTLGSVMSAIAALSAKVDDLQEDVTAVLNKLDLIQPSTSYTLTTLHTENAALGVDTGNLLNLIGLLMGGEEVLTIQTVLDAISALSALLPVAAPIWPGLASVTLGTPTALLDSMDIAGPMDGLIVAASGADAGTAHYTYHDVKAYRNVGALAFYTDRGDIEPFQTLGFEAAIYTPRTMARAGGAKLFTSRGLSGTVRTWTIS